LLSNVFEVLSLVYGLRIAVTVLLVSLGGSVDGARQQAAGGGGVYGTVAAGGGKVNELAELYANVSRVGEPEAVHAGVVAGVSELGGETDGVASLWETAVDDSLERSDGDHDLVEGDASVEGSKGELRDPRSALHFGCQKVHQMASHSRDDNTDVTIGWWATSGWVSSSSSAPGVLRSGRSTTGTSGDVGGSLLWALEVKMIIEVDLIVGRSVSRRVVGLEGLERSVNWDFVRQWDSQSGLHVHVAFLLLLLSFRSAHHGSWVRSLVKERRRPFATKSDRHLAIDCEIGAKSSVSKVL